MHRLLGALTVRGRSFVAAGAAAVVCGLLIPEPDLLRIGALLMALPLLSAFGSGRARYRLSCVRQMTPSRLPAGQTASLTIRLVNVSRLRTGLLLAEDTVPYALGSRPSVRVRGNRRRRVAGIHLSARRGRPRQVHHRAAAGPGGRLIRPGIDHPGVHHHLDADRHPGDRAADPAAARGQLARRQRPGPAVDRRQRRRRRGPPRLPHRGQPAPGPLAVHRALRRADGPPRGAVLAEHGVAVPRHPADSGTPTRCSSSR